MKQGEIEAGDVVFYKPIPFSKQVELDPEQEYKALVNRKKLIEPDIWMLLIIVQGNSRSEWIFLNQVTRKAEG